MEIIYKKIDELVPYVNNSRTHSDEQIDKICGSIKEYGWTNPVLIDEKNVIIAGHGRYLAGKKLGMEEIPCIVLSGLTEAQKKAYVIADNKMALDAGWNDELLKNELENLKELDFDLGLTGFDEKELDGIFNEIDEDEIKEDDFNEEPPEEPKAKLGDVYQLGNHRLMCGDSTKIEDVEKLMNGKKADMVFTDPPYNVAFNGRSGKFNVIKNDNLSNSEFEDFINKTISVIKYVNPPIYYIWCNWRFYGILQDKLNYKSCIVWAKNVFGLGDGYRHQHEFCLFNGSIDKEITNETDLWQISKDANYVHPTQKPIALCCRALKNHKKVKNVLDLFGGSGSTLIACEQLNRNCYMMELDPKYVDVIIKRWEDFTGEKAVLIEEGE